MNNNNPQDGSDNDNDNLPMIEMVELEYLTGRNVSDDELNERASEGWAIETIQFMPGIAGGEERLCVVWVRDINDDSMSGYPLTQPGLQSEIEPSDFAGETSDGETLEGFRTVNLEPAVSDDDLTDDDEDDERDADESVYPATSPVMTGWVFGHDAPPVGAQR